MIKNVNEKGSTFPKGMVLPFDVEDPPFFRQRILLVIYYRSTVADNNKVRGAPMAKAPPVVPVQ